MRQQKSAIAPKNTQQQQLRITPRLVRDALKLACTVCKCSAKRRSFHVDGAKRDCLDGQS
jgi:hypothetical protein